MTNKQHQYIYLFSSALRGNFLKLGRRVNDSTHGPSSPEIMLPPRRRGRIAGIIKDPRRRPSVGCMPGACRWHTIMAYLIVDSALKSHRNHVALCESWMKTCGSCLRKHTAHHDRSGPHVLAAAICQNVRPQPERCFALSAPLLCPHYSALPHL